MTSRERVACPDCGLQQALPAIGIHEVARCPRCHRLLKAPESLAHASLALTVAALLLWVPGCLAPLLTVDASGAIRSTNLLGCAARLWRAGYPPLGLLLVVLMLAVPTLFMLLQTLALALPIGRAPAPLCRRLAQRLRPWLMMEVFVVGGCVAYSRIQAVAAVSVDAGGWCLAGSATLLLGSLALLGETAPRHAPPPPLGSARISLQATTALVLTALVLLHTGEPAAHTADRTLWQHRDKHHHGRRSGIGAL